MSGQALAVDFFLIAHDPFNNGKLRISTELLGCGLVGAEIADLVMARRLAVDGERLVVRDTSGRIDDLGDYVIENVVNQASAHSVKSWIEPLQDGMYALVSRRLVMAGTVRREPGQRRLTRGGRQPDRFPANDLLAAIRPQQHLEQLLRAPRDLGLAAGMLAALIAALGLDRLLDPELDRAMLRELFSEIEQHLPADLAAICDGLRAVTAEVSLRAR